MGKTSIDSRKQKILHAVVQSYILSGKPVGSRTIADSYDLGISAATIRNEMAALEKQGFLWQPYTSAGRVPTDLGYRYYVDMLMGQPKPTGKDAAAVERLLVVRSRELEGLLREASLLLSRLTHTAAMVFAPFTPAEKVHRIEIVRLSEHQVMVIHITEKGEVGRSLINLREAVGKDTTERVSRYLNKEIVGKVVEEIDMDAVVAHSRFGAAGLALLASALDSIVEHLGRMEERVFVGGTANIVREMDSAGIESVEALLEALEKQYFILDLLKDLVGENRLTIRIGEENRLQELRNCAFVGTSYPVAPDLLGSLGVVGPTCMDYYRTIGMVQYMAENLGRRLTGPVD